MIIMAHHSMLTESFNHFSEQSLPIRHCPSKPDHQQCDDDIDQHDDENDNHDDDDDEDATLQRNFIAC